MTDVQAAAWTPPPAPAGASAFFTPAMLRASQGVDTIFYSHIFDAREWRGLRFQFIVYASDPAASPYSLTLQTALDPRLGPPAWRTWHAVAAFTSGGTLNHVDTVDDPLSYVRALVQVDAAAVGRVGVFGMPVLESTIAGGRVEAPPLKVDEGRLVRADERIAVSAPAD